MVAARDLKGWSSHPAGTRSRPRSADRTATTPALRFRIAPAGGPGRGVRMYARPRKRRRDLGRFAVGVPGVADAAGISDLSLLGGRAGLDGGRSPRPAGRANAPT